MADDDTGFFGRLLSSYFETEKPDEDEVTDQDKLYISSVESILSEREFEMPDPTDPEVVQRAMTKLRENGGTDRDRQEVDVGMKIDTIRDPVGVVEEFNETLYQIRKPLLRKMKSREQTEDRGIDTIGLESSSQQNENGLQYVIYEDEQGMLIGGASNIIRNLCLKTKTSPIERELIKRAYNESVLQTGVEELVAHTINGVVIYVPKNRRQGEEPPNTTQSPEPTTEEKPNTEPQQEPETEDMEQMGNTDSETTTDDDSGWF